MAKQQNNSQNHDDAKTFPQRLDFYWKFTSVYSVSLLCYFIIRGFIEDFKFSHLIKDPIVILLLLFVIGPTIALLYNSYKKRSILVGKTYIIFKTRFKEKYYSIQEIRRIRVGRERLMRHRNRIIRIIRIDVMNRRLPIKIRVTSFWNSKELVQAVTKLKQ